jgi:hypothetical protein
MARRKRKGASHGGRGGLSVDKVKRASSPVVLFSPI